MIEENEVVDSAETTTTDDLEDNSSDNESTGESEDASSTEGSEQHSTETPEQRSARLKRQIEREAKKQGKTVEEYLGYKGSKGSEEGGKESSKVDSDERYARLELKTEGVTSKKAQDIVLEYANWKGIDPIAALKSPIVKAEIAELEKKTSAPAPSKRTGTGASDPFEYWVAQARNGHFPRHDKEMMKKLQKGHIFKKVAFKS